MTSEEIRYKIDKITNVMTVPRGAGQSLIWQKIEKKVEEPRVETPVIKLWPSAQVTIAACMVLMLCFYALMNISNKEFIVPKGEMTTLYLPDSSKVIVNAESKLTYNERNWDEKREVTLAGEAFFEVKKGSQFRVISEDKMVTVLGTKFNVTARGDVYKVECISGKVKVSYTDSGERELLTAGLKTSFENKTLTEPTFFDTERVIGRKNGKFIYESTSLSTVFREIERQFDVKIQGETNDTRLYSGHFTNSDLDLALLLTTKPMNLHFKYIDQKTILVSSRPM